MASLSPLGSIVLSCVAVINLVLAIVTSLMCHNGFVHDRFFGV